MAYSDKERECDFKWFLENYDSLFKEYGHKFFAIRNKEILGTYESEVDAINNTSDKYPIGDFIVQECNGDESGYTNYISSWQLVFVK